MVARTTQLSSGGMITVRESVLRGSGPIGPQGPTGPTGTSIQLQGWKDTYNEIEALDEQDLQEGYAYYAQDTHRLYVWHRFDPDLDGGEWRDFGKVQGAAGYLNSVSARLITATDAANVDVSSGSTVRLQWKQQYVDSEFIDTSPTAIPIIATYIGQPPSPSVNTDNCHLFRTQIPAVAYNMDYPESQHPAAYLVVASVEINPATATRGEFTLQLVRRNPAGTETEVVAHATTYVYSENQTVTLTALVRGATDYWEVRAVSDGCFVRIEDQRLDLIRAGGGPGPQGPQGDQGLPIRAHPSSPVADNIELSEVNTASVTPGQVIYVASTGILHIWQETPAGSGTYGWFALGTIRGQDGSADDGFTEFDNLIPNDGATSLDAPTGTGSTPLTTSDQNVPYPDNDSRPHIPYYFKLIAEWFEKRVIARYSDATVRNTKRPTPEQGEVSYIGSGTDGTRGLNVYTGENGSGESGYIRIPTVIISTSTPPTGKTYPDGTLWLKV